MLKIQLILILIIFLIELIFVKLTQLVLFLIIFLPQFVFVQPTTSIFLSDAQTFIQTTTLHFPQSCLKSPHKSRRVPGTWRQRTAWLSGVSINCFQIVSEKKIVVYNSCVQRRFSALLNDWLGGCQVTSSSSSTFFFFSSFFFSSSLSSLSSSVVDFFRSGDIT